ncbi:MAG: hypothetical protein LUE17_03940 [Planctomycetaceae bacterium]|nr:hypothetical protein [Planctomycetaceae bacterium]
MSAVNSSQNSIFDPSVSTNERRAQDQKAASGNGLGNMDFLNLLLTQLQNQDPLSPMENMDFTSQLAQLQQLEEQMALTRAMTSLRNDSQTQSATGMIGKDVIGTDAAGNRVEGTVTRVIMDGNSVLVELNDGTRLPVGNVQEITSGDGASTDLAASSNALGKFVNATVPGQKDPVLGIVQSVFMQDGKVMLQLYGGKAVSWDQVGSMRAVTDDDSLYIYPDAVRQELEKAEGMLKKVITGTTDSGETVTGIMADADLDAEGNVYIILHDGTAIKLEKVTSSAKDPTAEEAEKYLKDRWAIGLDENGTAIEGLIAGAEQRDDGLVLLLSDGRHLYYDSTPVIRKPTQEELDRVAPTEEAGGADDSDDAGGDTERTDTDAA